MYLTLFQIQQVDLNGKIDSIQEKIQIYQNNIDKNISWFYAALAIVTTILLVALYFLVTESIKRGIDKGINKVESSVMREIELLKSNMAFYKEQIGEETLKLIKDNPQIRWAKGSIGGISVEQQGLVEVYNLAGPVNWSYPTTYIELRGIRSKRKLDYKIVQRLPDGFVAEVSDFRKEIDGVLIEWTIIWERDKG